MGRTYPFALTRRYPIVRLKPQKLVGMVGSNRGHATPDSCDWSNRRFPSSPHSSRCVLLAQSRPSVVGLADSQPTFRLTPTAPSTLQCPTHLNCWHVGPTIWPGLFPVERERDGKACPPGSSDRPS